MRRFALVRIISLKHRSAPCCTAHETSCVQLVYSGIVLAAGLAPALAARSHRRLEGGGRRRQHPRCRMQWQHVGRGGVGENTGRPRQQQSRCLKTEQADPGHADPDRHEEEARRSISGKAKSTTPRTASSTVPRSSRPVPTSSRFRAACWASSAAAKPGPASPARFPQARPTAWPRARRRPRARYPNRRRPQTARRRPPASVGAAPKAPVRSWRRTAQPADPVGDICLLPDIARFAH